MPDLERSDRRYLAIVCLLATIVTSQLESVLNSTLQRPVNSSSLHHQILANSEMPIARTCRADTVVPVLIASHFTTPAKLVAARTQFTDFQHLSIWPCIPVDSQYRLYDWA